ncbi:hypothetical protein G4L39_04300 [Limisphaera ngatamarikiensis]|uniref:Uncharacterized protein n=2 Tax=Limisphaera ngatamarikiensis TaxID=1324935 RepID=A0A6M1RLV5_9BACT|nr:hypothetical protein [Limisphaera ngatamarikiensis]
MNQRWLNHRGGDVPSGIFPRSPLFKLNAKAWVTHKKLASVTRQVVRSGAIEPVLMHKGADNFAVALATKLPSETAIASWDNRQAPPYRRGLSAYLTGGWLCPQANVCRSVPFPFRRSTKATKKDEDDHATPWDRDRCESGPYLLDHAYPQLMDYHRDVRRRCDNNEPTALLLAYALGNLTDAFAGGFQVIGAWQTYWLLLSNFDGYESSCW